MGIYITLLSSNCITATAAERIIATVRLHACFDADDIISFSFCSAASFALYMGAMPNTIFATFHAFIEASHWYFEFSRFDFVDNYR